MIDSVDLSKQTILKVVLNDAFRDYKINAVCEKVTLNKHLAFFDVRLSDGVSGSSDLSKIQRRAEEIALRLKSKTVPIMSVLTDEGIVRLKVAMRKADAQNLENLYNNYTIPSDRDMMIPLVLGEGEDGERLVIDFAQNPHTLIAGATSSGKSVLLHNIIANMVYLNTLKVRDIQLYLVDPKQVEFVSYEGDQFKNSVVDVVSSYNDTVKLMKDLEEEMEMRYSLLKDLGYKSLRDCPGRLSQIVVVIDEVADLMGQDKKTKQFEKSVIRLAQKARAAGIHIIMATQRPSADVITGLIKDNFPARIACKTASPVGSRVILDSVGAENLQGRGDAIMKNFDFNLRFQVAYSDPKNTERTLSRMRK